MIHGVLLINKPAGMTSFDVVRRVKKLVHPLKVGHTGTLDPMADGLLPLTLGEATKLTGFLQAGQKRYSAQLKLGASTDTLDREGKITAEAPVPADLDPARLEQVLEQFRGEIQQVPPMYSALHHKGKRLHQLAREGQEVAREPRTVHVYELTAESSSSEHLELKVHCSAGTYVRTLGADIAKGLGSLGHLTALTRTESAGWRLEQALALEGLEREAIEADLLPLAQVVERFNLTRVPDEVLARLSQGQRMRRKDLDALGIEALEGRLVCFAPEAGRPLVMTRLKGRDEDPALDILRVLLPEKH